MNTARLESFIFDKMADTRLPGLSIALVKDDEVVYARGFGQRDLAHGLPATPDTLYGIGSVTKSFTALAIMQLVEKGLLELSDPVEKHLPFAIKPKGERVRVEHLLSHTAGMPALAYGEALIRYTNETGGRHLPIGGPEDILTFMQGSDDWEESTPGERWAYFNEGYALLGLIIERLSGRRYADYVRQEILEPLGMNRSFFEPSELERDQDVAVPYVLPQDGLPRAGRYLFRTIRSEGGLMSSVLELTKYLELYLGQTNGVVSAESLQAMFEPRIAMPSLTCPERFGREGAAQPLRHYGYGLSSQRDFFGETLIGHGGSVLVSTAHLAFIPKRNVGVAVLANGSGYPMAFIAEVALALLLEHNPDDLDYLRTDHALSKLTGRYETYKGTMQATVTRQGDFLVLELHDQAQPQRIILVPENLTGTELSFYTLTGGGRLPVQFRVGERLELNYERYKLRRSSPH